MSYLNTLRLRNNIADGHQLAKETVLDLLTRIEHYQDKELRQLALENHPAEMPKLDLSKAGMFEAWQDDTPINNIITDMVQGVISYAAARSLVLDPATLRLEFDVSDDTHAVRLVGNTKPAKDQK